MKRDEVHLQFKKTCELGLHRKGLSHGIVAEIPTATSPLSSSEAVYKCSSFYT